MRQSVVVAASAAAAILAPGILHAQDQVQVQTQAPASMPAMSHQEKVTFAQWSARVQKDLTHELHYPHPMLGAPAASGVVQVKFNCSESGRPDKVAIAHSSGSGALDRAALRAVSRIATLHPLPASFAQGQAFQAMILFDTDSDSSHARRDRMIADAMKNNARFASPDVAMIGVAAAGGGGGN